ncbi:hypothetical protein GGS24DRAFT_488558 [Hypoxylon argillaceum]|nr:hypothetical protein GGS24DRAFT_488558 [Hypoxylon argillaceum]
MAPEFIGTQRHWHDRSRGQWSIDSLLDYEPAAASLADSGCQSPGSGSNPHTTSNSVAAKLTQYQRASRASFIHESPCTSIYSCSLVEQPDPPVDHRINAPRARLNFTRRVRRAWNHGWVAEIFCCVLAISSLIAIIVTLRLYQDKPLPRWPLGITINALIAVLGVVMKAGLAVPLSEGISELKWQWFEKHPRTLTDMEDFDTASRGAWGSFLFLFSTRSKGSGSPRRADDPRNMSGYLAKLATLVIVLTVAVDPFTQQVIVHVECSQVSPELRSSIARTDYYNATSSHVPAGENHVDGPMALAINTGVIAPPKHIPSLVSTECKSGNCTFPNFSSVGVCHSCEDLSSQIRNVTDEKRRAWKFTLPGNKDFPSLYLYHEDVLKTSATFKPGLDLLDLRIMSQTDPSAPTLRLSAFHCTIAPCVQTYSALMVDSTLNETVLSSTIMGFQDDLNRGSSPSYYRLVTSQTLRKGQEEACISSENEGPGLIKVANANVDAAPDYSLKNALDIAWYPEDCVWSFGFDSRSGILGELRRQLDNLDMQHTRGVVVGPIATKNLWLNGIADLESTDSYFQKLAEVMTATMRNHGAGGVEDYARGEVTITKTCVSVQWAWLSYPIVLVGLATLFLVFVFLQTLQEPSVRIWKSSALALLLLSVDESRCNVKYYDMTKNDMNQVAETVSVQLKRGKDGKISFS